MSTNTASLSYFLDHFTPKTVTVYTSESIAIRVEAQRSILKLHWIKDNDNRYIFPAKNWQLRAKRTSMCYKRACLNIVGDWEARLGQQEKAHLQMTSAHLTIDGKSCMLQNHSLTKGNRDRIFFWKLGDLLYGHTIYISVASNHETYQKWHWH